MGLITRLAGIVTELAVIVIEVMRWSLEKFHTFTIVVSRILVVTFIIYFTRISGTLSTSNVMQQHFTTKVPSKFTHMLKI